MIATRATTTLPRGNDDEFEMEIDMEDEEDNDDDSASTGMDGYDDDDELEDDLFPDAGLSFTGVPANLCGDGPRIMTVSLPAGQPLAFYAQVEAFHRRSILPHVRIVVAKPVVGGDGSMGEGAAATKTGSVGLYRVFRDQAVARGAREGALRKWLPPDSDFRKQVDAHADDAESGGEEDDDDEKDAEDEKGAYLRGTGDAYASPDEFGSSEEEEDEDEDDEDEDSEADVPPQSTTAELVARLPGTSLGYWAAAADPVWLF